MPNQRVGNIDNVRNSSDREVLRAVFSRRAANADPQNIPDIEASVMDAFNKVISSGQSVSVSKIESVISSTDRMAILNEDTPALDSVFSQSDLDQNLANNTQSTHGYFDNEGYGLRTGSLRTAGIGQAYGKARRGAGDVGRSGVASASTDALGAFVWNFADSLLLGIPDFALNKLGGNNGFSDFMRGMRDVDTEAGKYAQAGGVVASFFAGGIFGAAGKAGAVLKEGNLIGKTFAIGGKVGRRATGVTGAISKLSKEVRVAKSSLNSEKAIAATTSELSKLQKVRAELFATKKEIQLAERSAKTSTKINSIAEVEAGIQSNSQRIAKAMGKKAKLRSLASKEKEIQKVIGDGVKKAGEAFYNQRRGLAAKEATKLVEEGFSAGLKQGIVDNVSDDLMRIIGDSDIVAGILKKTLNGADDAVNAIIKGTKTWSEVLAEGSPILKGLSGRVGAVLQNGMEEAIGFATHTFITGTIKRLGETADYSLDNLVEMAKEGVSDSGRSAVTAFAFAGGGAIPFLNAGRSMFTVPMKLFKPSRNGEIKTLFKAAFGMTEGSANVFEKEIKSFLKKSGKVNSVFSEFKRGVRGGSGSIMEKLRSRGLIDYAKLGAEDPASLALIAEKLIKTESSGGLAALASAGGITTRSEMKSVVGELYRALRRGDGKIIDEAGSGTIKKLSALLTSQAERAIEMNWVGLKRGALGDIGINAMTTASIFFGTGGLDMINGLQSGDTHMSDVLSHFAFSAMSGGHGLHLMPGKPIGNVNYDSRITPSERFMADSQNKELLRIMGVDIGDSYLFTSKPQSNSRMLGLDSKDPQTAKLFSSLHEVKESDITPMRIVNSGAEVADPRSEARVNELFTVLGVLKEAGVKFPEGHALESLNKLISEPNDNKLAEDLRNEKSDIVQSLATVVAIMKKEAVRSNIITDMTAPRTAIDDSFIMNYLNVHHTKMVNVLSDFGAEGFNRIQQVLSNPSNSIGLVKMGNLDSLTEEQMHGLDKNLVGLMLDRLIDVAATTNQATVDYNSSTEPFTGEQASAVIEVLADINTRMKESLNGSGLDTPHVTRELDNLIRSGFATSVKSVFVDGRPVSLVKNDVALGYAGFEDLEKAAIQRNFVKIKGNLRVVRSIDEKLLREAGMSPDSITGLRNFLKLLRATYGYNSQKGSDLSVEEAMKYVEQMPLEVGLGSSEHSISSWNIEGLGLAMSIDFADNIGMSDAEYHIMRAKYSKVGRDVYSMFDFLRKIGFIYDDPVQGTVYMNLNVMGNSKPETFEDVNGRTKTEVSINSSPEDKLIDFLRIKALSSGESLDAQEFRKSSSDFAKNYLMPIIKELENAGILSGEAGPTEYGVIYGKENLDRVSSALLDLATARSSIQNTHARLQVVDFIEKIADAIENREFSPADKSKLYRIKDRLMEHLGGNRVTAYDWYQVSQLMKNNLDFSMSDNDARLRLAIDKANSYLSDTDFADSAIESFFRDDRSVDADEFDHLRRKSPRISLNFESLLGEDGANIPDVREKRFIIARVRNAAMDGIPKFIKTIETVFELTNRISEIPSRSELLGLYSSVKAKRGIDLIKFGDFKDLSSDIPNEDGIFETVEAGTNIKNIYINDGYIHHMSDDIGIKISLLDGMISLAGSNYSLRSRHSESVEAQKSARISELENGGLTYLFDPIDGLLNRPDDGSSRGAAISSRKSRSIVLQMSGTNRYLVFDLPSTREEAIALGKHIKKIANLYEGERRNTILGAARDEAIGVADILINGHADKNFIIDPVDGKATYRKNGPIKDAQVGGFKIHPNIAGTTGDGIRNTLRFLMNHYKLGISGMKEVPARASKNKSSKDASRDKQILSSSFVPTNREVFDSYAIDHSDPTNSESKVVGYSEGRLRGVIVTDEILEGIDLAGVAQSDGQVFFHSSVLRAIAYSNGYDESPGVVKNHILDFKQGMPDADGNTVNIGTLLTKNAGTSNPEMDAILEKLNIGFISMTSATKFMGVNTVGSLVNREGKDISYIDAVNNVPSVSGVRDGFEIPIESVRTSKIPHSSKATIAYQVENTLSDSVVRDIISRHFEGKIGGESGVGLVDMARKIFDTTPEGRAKARALFIKYSNEQRLQEFAGISDGGTGASMFERYLRNSKQASPNDFWFKKKAMSVLKSGFLSDSLFKSREAAGRQDILSSDYKGILDTMEAVGSDAMNSVMLNDSFSGNGDGITFSFKAPKAMSNEDVAADVAVHFGFDPSVPNYFNRMADGAGVGLNHPDRAAQDRLLDGRYLPRRLYRVDIEKGTRIGNSDSFIESMLNSGISEGLEGGIFSILDSSTSQGQIRAINNIVIDIIHGNSLSGPDIKAAGSSFNKYLLGDRGKDFRNLIHEIDGTNNLLNGKYSVGRVFDVIGLLTGKYNYHHRNSKNSLGLQAKTWGIVGLAQRYPAARINDTIPLVFLGTAHKSMSGQLIMNYFDGAMKGEADYDIDNYNYWLNSPTSHLAHAYRLRSAAGINSPEPSEQVGDTLGRPMNPFNNNDINSLGKSDQVAQFLRGSVIKAGSLVEKLIKNETVVRITAGGRDYVIRSKYKTIDEMSSSDEGIVDSMYVSRMVQEIIDSKDGLLRNNRQNEHGEQLKGYRDKSFNAFEEILKRFFVVEAANKQDYFGTDGEIEWRPEFVDAMSEAVSYYRKLLNFNKDAYEGDAKGASTWAQMATIASDYVNMLNSGNMNKAIEDQIYAYLNVDRPGVSSSKKGGSDALGISHISVSMKHKTSIAENAAVAVAKLDSIAYRREGSELYGRALEEITYLARYIASHKYGESGPSMDEIAEFAGELKSKGWNLARIREREKAIRADLSYSSQQAVNGSEYHSRKSRQLIGQLKEIGSIKTAIEDGRIKDPNVMEKFSTPRERSEAWDNIKDVAAAEYALGDLNLDQGLLDVLLKSARKVQKKRGFYYARSLNDSIEGHRAAYGKDVQKDVMNLVADYLKEWSDVEASVGLHNFNIKAALLALLITEESKVISAGGNKRFPTRKKMPGDLFNIATDLLLRSDVDMEPRINEVLGMLAYSRTLADALYEGNASELNALIKQKEIERENKSRLAVALRFSNNPNELNTAANVLISISGENVGGVRANNAVRKLFGVPIGQAGVLHERSPAEMSEEVLSIAKRQRAAVVDIVQSDGSESKLIPIARVSLKEYSGESDQDGVALKIVKSRLLATTNYDEKKAANAYSSSGASGLVGTFSGKEQKLANAVMAENNKRKSRAVKLILDGVKPSMGRDSDIGSGGPGDFIETLTVGRSSRDQDVRAENSGKGGC